MASPPPPQVLPMAPPVTGSSSAKSHPLPDATPSAAAAPSELLPRVAPSAATALYQLLPGVAPSGAAAPSHLLPGVAHSAAATLSRLLPDVASSSAAAPVLPRTPRSPLAWEDISLGFPSTTLNPSASSRPSTPRQHHSQDFPSPSMRPVEIEINHQEVEDQRRKKRKSPLTSMLLFRSPLSRMLLSPQLRSPTARHERSPTARFTDQEVVNIDLNLEPIEHAPENSQNAHPDVENGSDIDTSAALQAEENVRRRAVVPDEKRRAIFESLMAKARNGNLKGHETSEVSEEFSVPLRTVQRIWKKGKNCLDEGMLVDVSSGKSRCGRKKLEIDVSTLSDLPMSSRTTIHDVAQHFGVSKSKLHAMKREGIIKRVSNSIKPYLTDQNKKDRLKWCLSMLDPRSLPHDPMFQELFDYVFIDEKFYYITRKTERYYTLPGEEQPVRTCKSKNFIPKIMILTVVARPRFNSLGFCTFDGKIGCFPFVTYEPAKRSSANRPAGTMEMKPINSVNKDVIRAFMIEKVLPAIRAKWPPQDASKPIFIQQDNARPHLAPNDRMFCEAAKQHGFDIRLVNQPANSPDLNVLDLGFFNTIQSIQYKTASRTTEELVAAVGQAFERYSERQANRIFLTLHGCMKEVMKLGGGNGYDLPHIRKGMLERQGRLPLQLKCEAHVVQEAMARINE